MKLLRLMLLLTFACIALGMVRGIEVRTPYYEMDGGLWIDLREPQIHGLHSIGIRKKYRGGWSGQVDWYRGAIVEFCEPGIHYGTSQHGKHPRMWWFSIHGPLSSKESWGSK